MPWLELRSTRRIPTSFWLRRPTTAASLWNGFAMRWMWSTMLLKTLLHLTRGSPWSLWHWNFVKFVCLFLPHRPSEIKSIDPWMILKNTCIVHMWYISNMLCWNTQWNFILDMGWFFGPQRILALQLGCPVCVLRKRIANFLGLCERAGRYLTLGLWGIQWRKFGWYFYVEKPCKQIQNKSAINFKDHMHVISIWAIIYDLPTQD